MNCTGLFIAGYLQMRTWFSSGISSSLHKNYFRKLTAYFILRLDKMIVISYVTLQMPVISIECFSSRLGFCNFNS